MSASDMWSEMQEAENVSRWERVGKFDCRTAALADQHYSRRTVGSRQFMPPGQTLILLSDDERSVFGWWRPDPASGIRQMNNRSGWTCTIFRNTGSGKSSALIIQAETALALSGRGCGPDGMLTYVHRSKVRSSNPGCCFKKAGWRRIGESADKKKDLLQKPFDLAGIWP